MIVNKKLSRKYWYRFHVGECPVCGRDASWKERVYGKRPKTKSRRYVHIPDTEFYDHCM